MNFLEIYLTLCGTLKVTLDATLQCTPTRRIHMVHCIVASGVHEPLRRFS